MTDAKPAEAKEVAYEAIDTIRFGIHAGYQPGDSVPADVVKNNPAETEGKVKRV